MSWSSGSNLALEIWEMIDTINDWDTCEFSKGEVVHDIVKIFEKYDCDTMCELEFVNDHLYWDDEKNEWSIIKLDIHYDELGRS